VWRVWYVFVTSQETVGKLTLNVARDVTLLVASCVTALGVISLVCLHCLSRTVACRRRSTVSHFYYYTIILL